MPPGYVTVSPDGLVNDPWGGKVLLAKKYSLGYHKATGMESSAADQVIPPSPLISSNTSKKLLISNAPPGPGRIRVNPGEARVGLSRNCTPAGSEPPDKSSCNISVS